MPAPDRTRHLPSPARVGVVATAVLATTLAASAQMELRIMRDPIYLTVDAGLSQLLDPATHPTLVDDLATQITTAAEGKAGRLVLVHLTAAPLTYDDLPTLTRRAVDARVAAGADTAAWYEETMSDVLRAVIAESHRRSDVLLSVLGVPVESRAPEGASPRYMSVVAELDALVSTRGFILSESANEIAQLRRTLPAYFEHAAGRPIFYRTNRTWRAVVDPAMAWRWEEATVATGTGDDALVEGYIAATTVAPTGVPTDPADQIMGMGGFLDPDAPSAAPGGGGGGGGG
ncbi:MAG: hypothetical protein HKO59_15130, partial [Phycisphaerales bacterium]|nr:hypothetical protein [Phycisphaerales bacterium]NNM27293.1 hypothetical protein [Phycisphaerales bacterium]